MRDKKEILTNTKLWIDELCKNILNENYSNFKLFKIKLINLYDKNIIDIIKANSDLINIKNLLLNSTTLEIFIDNFINKYKKDFNSTYINNIISKYCEELNKEYEINIKKYYKYLEESKINFEKELFNKNNSIIIDNFIFKVVYVTKEKRNLTLIKSYNLESKEETRFILYRSLSEVGTWRLTINLMGQYQKPGDYVTGTFIHMKLQSFIIKNFEKFNLYDKLDQSDIQYMSFNYDTLSFLQLRPGEICDSSDFNILKTFCNDIDALCGYYNYFLKDVKKKHLKKINIFIHKHELKMDTFDINNNSYMYSYKYILNVINLYLKKKFVKITSNPIFLFKYDFNIEDTKIYNINVFKQDIMSIDTKQVFEYYYIKYKITLKEFKDDEFNAPLFIIPKKSKVCNYGVYDCYIRGCFYFCKPIEYSDKCEYNYKECLKRTISYNYRFIGDIITNQIVNFQEYNYKNQLLSIFPIFN